MTFTDNNNTSQRFLANLAGLHSFPCAVSYIPTGMLGAGSLSATSTFTLSYQ
ncbi:MULTISPECIES: hypothetical protein [Aquitalea]|uniref:hypothetical protein n=1 Tax=Aquitalea TaxID=407217 RepID=UPI0013159721|nr:MULTISPECIES: hypothetical protein [Aquitalea]